MQLVQSKEDHAWKILALVVIPGVLELLQQEESLTERTWQSQFVEHGTNIANQMFHTIEDCNSAMRREFIIKVCIALQR